MLHVLHKVPYIFVDGNIDVMEVRLMMFKFQSQGTVKIIIIHGNLQAALARKAGHLHPCTSLLWFVVELRFLDLTLVLCAVKRVCPHGIGGGAFLALLVAEGRH